MLGLTTEAVKDLAERAVRTFAQAFLALYAPVVLGADSLGGLLDLSVADKAAAAGVAAVLSLVMGAFGTKVGSTEDNASVR
jgi:hypothetical protein